MSQPTTLFPLMCFSLASPFISKNGSFYFSLTSVAIPMCARAARTYTRTYTYSLACLLTCIHTFIFHHAYVDTRMDTCTHMLTRNNISTTCCRLKRNARIRGYAMLNKSPVFSRSRAFASTRRRLAPQDYINGLCILRSREREQGNSF